MTAQLEDMIRSALDDELAPTSGDVTTQRARLVAGIHGVTHARTRPVRPRRGPRRLRLLLPAVGLAAAALVAGALLPGRGDDRSAPASEERLYLVKATAGGAFSGIDVDSATAAQVLEAAARSTTNGIPPHAGDWSFTRMEQEYDGQGSSVTERWTSPDGEQAFFISAATVGDNPPVAHLHYERLRDGVIGDVTWTDSSGGPGPRRATWHVEDDGAAPNADIARHVELRERLWTAASAADVRAALDAVLDDAGLEFRDGTACDVPDGPCSGFGNAAMSARGMGDAQSRRVYEQGMLVSSMTSNAYPTRATGAIYDYLASQPELAVRRADDGSGDVVLEQTLPGPQMRTRRVEPSAASSTGVHYESSPVPGTTHHTVPLARIDGGTGRVTGLATGPNEEFNSSYDAVGLATGPAVGGKLCGEFPDACAELRDLAERLEQDPDAQFEGVLDHMFIDQLCDGLIDRDSDVIEDAPPPPRVSGDPERIREAEECRAREAAAARGD